jgi:hypothetical protein
MDYDIDFILDDEEANTLPGMTAEERAEQARWLAEQERLADLRMDREIDRSAVYSR